MLKNIPNIKITTKPLSNLVKKENNEFMNSMFLYSNFKGDLSNWKPYKLQSMLNMFFSCDAPTTYWGKIKNTEQRIDAIKSHHQKETLEDILTTSTPKTITLKI